MTLEPVNLSSGEHVMWWVHALICSQKFNQSLSHGTENERLKGSVHWFSGMQWQRVSDRTSVTPSTDKTVSVRTISGKDIMLIRMAPKKIADVCGPGFPKRKST